MAASVRAVIFDLGGVLVNIDFSRAIAAWARAAGLSYAPLHGRYEIDDAYRRHERGEIDASSYFDSLRSSLQINLTDDQFLHGWNALLLDEIAGIRALVQRAAAQVPVAVFSNTNPTHHAAWTARHPALLACFDMVYVSTELGVRKPEAPAFAAVLADLGITAGEALFFDDTAENVLAARALGITAVQVASVRDVEQGLAQAGL